MLMLGALLSEDFVVFIECDSSELYLSAGGGCIAYMCIFSNSFFVGAVGAF